MENSASQMGTQVTLSMAVIKFVRGRDFPHGILVTPSVT